MLATKVRKEGSQRVAMCRTTVYVVQKGETDPSVELKPCDGYTEQFASVSLGSPEFETLQDLAFALYRV